ncbi:hypothetical protein FHS43_004480 [Streptosporangium becharense]|uniref:Uncharacterized protein n=1 Tax=Streptosporangium becharense TaxID=1816182 RepID=A0A7W9IK15_9ACTN|nr:hypothetical protein [Streptosporangium becharense]MBB2913182.1 hypothetical protein [Streptosporangium becharense]MBB5822165.1 hypothetical protein [Streptosporangium becharense]
MASEQSSQPHPPPAWPEAAEPVPSWANDPLGTGPRLPRPQEDAENGARQNASPGGNGWPQPTPAQDGTRQNASDPRNGGHGSTSPGGWAQATAPQGDVWQNSSGAQGDTWQNTSGAQSDVWQNASTPRNDTWQNTSGSQGDVWQNTSGPRNDGHGQGFGAPQSDPGRAAGHPESGSRPSASPAESAVWPPAGNGSWPPAASADGSAYGTGTAGTQDRMFSPPAWASASIDAPADPGGASFGGAEQNGRGEYGGPGAHNEPGRSGGSGNGDAFGAGNGNGVTGGTGHGGLANGGAAEQTVRLSYGVPDNPAMWAMAAASAAQAAPAPAPQESPGRPGGTGPHPTHGHPTHSGQPGQPGQFGHPGQFGRPDGTGQPDHRGQPGQFGRPDQPGHHLSRDPSDPSKPFVTAGQISGPKTPPPERQQELWDTVFGESYEGLAEGELEGRGRPVWIFALAGSVVIALVGATVWAFLAGPLASDEEIVADSPKPSATAKKTTKPAAVGRLPRFSGKASPVAGTLTDQPAGITLAKLGAPWRQDQRPTVPTSYGFTTRQYLPAGTDSTGKAQFAQIMSGPLSPRLKSKYTSPKNLAPVINAVASTGRKKFFPEDNSARKTAQQTLSVNGMPGQLAAYEITSGDTKTTMVVAAVSTGADVPAIVYMSVPDSKKELLPDVNTVFKSIKVQGQ